LGVAFVHFNNSASDEFWGSDLRRDASSVVVGVVGGVGFVVGEVVGSGVILDADDFRRTFLVGGGVSSGVTGFFSNSAARTGVALGVGGAIGFGIDGVIGWDELLIGSDFMIIAAGFDCCIFENIDGFNWFIC
jgi:hypothetical protein